jgi:transposase-like protein
MVVLGHDDVGMVDVELSDKSGAGLRRWRSADERRRVVEETLEAGASVARVALKYGINANQVFQWRRLYRLYIIRCSTKAITIARSSSAIPLEQGDLRFDRV